ncbi:MAG TPA: HD domain-containing protein [Gaiellaceae bacterium]|nr:HD domain-containing protein [Gaiellaceae bacterium]
MGLQLNTARTPDNGPWSSRLHPQSSRPNSGRSSYEVDRDRIIHSATFRELQYKTQVQGLLGRSHGSVYRTRLNHVLEVAQIARGVGRLIGADEALCEVIALAHDLGHPPFGHAGERALSDALRDHGHPGWNANTHSLEVVDSLEAAFIDFRGLNLTWATREGIARHATPFDEPVAFGEFAATPMGGIECQIVDVADVFAYLSHDLDDALAGEYVSMDQLRELPTISELIDDSETKWFESSRVWPDAERPTLVRRRVVSMLIYRFIQDTASYSLNELQRRGLASAVLVREDAERAVVPKPEHQALVSDLLDLLTTLYYRSTSVAETDQLARQLVTQLLDALIANPALVPPRFRRDDAITDAANYLAALNDLSASQLASDLGI